MKIDNFFAELKRRNVYKVAVAYAVVAWLLIQVATQVFPFFELPNWAVQMVVLAMVIGFPIALVCSWAFEMTLEGIKLERDIDRRVTRKTGRKLTALIYCRCGSGGRSDDLSIFAFGARQRRKASYSCSRNRQQVDRCAPL